MSDLRTNLVVSLFIFAFAFAITLPSVAVEHDGPAQVSQELRGQAIDMLRQILEQESRWVKVHAADFLLMLDYPQGVAEVFARELDESGDVPEYRIGIWRVLARAALQDKQRNDWVAKIRDVFFDENAPDRLHAAETLGKLGYTVREKGDELFEDMASSNNDSLSVFVQWVLANSKREGATARLAKFLSSDDASVRGNAAYALRFLPRVSPEVGKKIVAAVQNESVDSSSRVYLVASATIHAPEESRPPLKDQMLAYFDTGTDDEKYEACIALSQIGTNDDLPLLASLLKDTNADVRSASAYAILRIAQRQLKKERGSK
ncbi:MAG: hypothetical protein GXP28_07255 [Planctomycetes bacterium]|nr:hypothetical protein [Planctomycetota bacterium]